jgi:hypothetical protein
MSFTARYHGECSEGDHIIPGELIEYDEDDEVRHVNCRATVEYSPSVCSTCNMVHAGECL